MKIKWYLPLLCNLLHPILPKYALPLRNCSTRYRYVKTWFWLDLVSSIPWDYISAAVTSFSSSSALLGASRALRILRMAKLLSLLRLLRITRLCRYINQYEEVRLASH